MKVTQNNIDDLTLRLTIEVVKEDYAEKVKKALADYRRKAEIKGFRKGMAPMSLIQKFHGPQALAESVNGLIYEGLNNHLKENKINIIAEPLPNETEQKQIDWEKDETFEFVFDVALAPVVDYKPSNGDEIVSYNVTVTDEAKKEFRSNMLKQFGHLEPCESVKEEDFIVADLEQEGMKIEGTYVTLRNMDEASKKLFLGKKAGDSFELNVNEVFTNEADRAGLLRVKKEELAGLNPMFNLTIVEVKNFVEAEANQETFDKAFGKDVVKTEEEFDAKLTERLAAEYKQESDYRFMLDTKEYFIEKAGIKLPEDFLKRWLFTINEGTFTMEDIEKDFHLFVKDFKWQLIRQQIMKDNNIEVTPEEMKDQAKRFAAYQFAMYGMPNVPEENLEQYAEAVLKNQEEAHRIYEKVEDDKTVAFIKSVVTLKAKDITIDELHKLTA